MLKEVIKIFVLVDLAVINFGIAPVFIVYGAVVVPYRNNSG